MTQRVVLVSSCDALARLALRELVPPPGWTLAGIVRTHFDTGRKLKLLKAAIRARSFYYALYMQLEILGARRHLAALGDGVAPWDPARADVPRFDSGDVNDDATAAFIQAAAPTLILSVRPGHIFRQRLIGRMPPILNLHCSRLPYHKGIGGVLQALAQGDPVLATTIHLIDSDALDSGPIMAQGDLAASPGRSVLWHTLRLYQGAGPLIGDAMVALAAGRPGRVSDDPGSYNSWPGPAPLHALHRRGAKLFQWSEVLK